MTKPFSPLFVSSFIFVLFCASTSLSAQTPAIEAAEKTFAAAKIDSLNTPQYVAAFKGLWAAYRTYILTEKKDVPDSIKIILVERDTVYKTQMDSLSRVAATIEQKKTAAFRQLLREKEEILYRDMISSLASMITYFNWVQLDFFKAYPLIDAKTKWVERVADKALYFQNGLDKVTVNKGIQKFDTAQIIGENTIKELDIEINRFERLSKKEKAQPQNLWFRKSKSMVLSIYAELVNSCVANGDYNGAVSNGKKGVAIYKEAIKDTFNQIDSNLYPHTDLAYIYTTNRVFDSAQMVIDDGWVFAQNNHSYFSSLKGQQTGLYREKGEIRKAYQSEKERFENAINEDERSLAALGLTTLCMGETGQYDEAEKWLVFWETYAIKNFGVESALGGALPNFLRGVIYRGKGQLEKAKYAFERSIEIHKKLQPEDKNDYKHYVLLLNDLGQYEQALNIQREIYNDTKKYSFKNDRSVSRTLSNLGHSLAQVNKLDSALICYQEALDLNRAAKMDFTEDDFGDMTSIVAILVQQRKYLLAETKMKEAFVVAEKIQSIQPKFMGSAKYQLADLLRKQGKYSEAFEASHQALKILRGGHGLSKALLNHALLHESQGENRPAMDSLQNLFVAIQSRIEQEFGYLSEQEKVSFMTKLDQDLFGAMQAACVRFYTKGEAARSGALLYNTLLQQKELSLLDTRSLKRKATLSGDTLLQEQVYKIGFWQDKAAETATSAAVKVQLNTDIAALKAAIEQKYPQFFEKKRLNATWQTVQQQLKTTHKNRKIAIEFADVVNPDDSLDNRHYYAVVVTPDSAYPIIIPLFEEKDLQKWFDATLVKEIDSKGIERILEDRTAQRRYQDPDFGQKLYDLVWRPIENAQILRGGDTVYFAPSGLLYQLSLPAVRLAKDVRLMDKYILRQQTTTRHIAQAEPYFNRASKAAVFGGMNYDFIKKGGGISFKSKENADNPALIARSAFAEDAFNTCWQPLPDALKEVIQVDNLLHLLMPQVQRDTGSNATEEAFRNLGRPETTSPNIIHIATHGFYNPTTYSESRYAPAALHRSGLVMAGANQRTCQRQKTDTDQHDGILTAYEIAQLNLSHTDLVVLSGCQTGLGANGGREGVFGLTRAFKLAGTGYTIASLWRIPDADARQFMVTFYAFLDSKYRTIPEAFDMTRKLMVEQQDANGWAAWVLIR
jgi:CHAT domain-containing protein